MGKVDDARLTTLPTATGGIARAAYVQASARLDVEPLLKRAGLTLQQIRNPDIRIGVRNQIRFLNLVASELHDEFLGIRLAQNFELRELGLLYYVQASSETLGDALQRAARYSMIHNEGVHIRLRHGREMSIALEYVGVSRALDCHQMEFFITTIVRGCRHLTGRHLLPSGIKFVHRRTELPSEIRALFGCDVVFGSDVDELVYPEATGQLALASADSYLNSLLIKYCDEALAHRRAKSRAWRLSVENAIAPLLPHGQARIGEVSQRLGVSPRTLGRRLESEGMTFSAVLDKLRYDLAKRYLQERALPISEIAWLLGYRETSAFNHAFRRWTGKAPRQAHSDEVVTRLPLARSA
jgi:AraC-like DNA-binding protein